MIRLLKKSTRLTTLDICVVCKYILQNTRMIKKIILTSILIVGFFILVSSVVAQVTPTSPIVSGATDENIANCDLCGYCQGEKPPSNWESCRKCLYRQLNGPATSNITLKGLPQPDQNHYYTMLGCLSTQPSEFAGQIAQVFFSLVGGIAFLFFIYGALIIATSQANPEKLNYGKRVVYAAITGLLFVLFSTFIIRFIAVDILKIPGFGG